MKQSLRLSTKQSLSMTPQLQQAIKLLQLSAAELEMEILSALESNPLLETIDKSSETSDPPVDTIWDDVESNLHSEASQNYSQTNTIDSFNAPTETLQDHLLWQLNTTHLSDIDKIIALTIIDSINDDGYLETSLTEIQSTLLNNYPQELADVNEEEILAVLHRIQQFDPIGIGARDLQECMLLQLSALPDHANLIAKCRELATNHLDLLAIKNYTQLKKHLQINEDQLQKIVNIITHLNPRPGKLLAFETSDYIVPDVIVKKINNRWVVSLNSNITSNIRINPNYSSLVKRADNSRDNQFLREQLNEAKCLLNSINTRNQTLLKVATYIVQHQLDFLEHGAQHMRSLTLHEVADIVNLNESTISRITNKKYIDTPQGLFELKYFFSNKMLTNDGTDCSSTAIKAIIKELVSKETAARPLSDQAIAEIMQQRGIQIARRTVTKYRESLKIKSSSQRKFRS